MNGIPTTSSFNLLADMEFLKQYNSDSELSDADIKDRWQSNYSMSYSVP